MPDADVNFDDVVDADDIEQQVIEDVVNGVQSFSDGTHSVSMIDPEKRLDVIDRLRRTDATTTPSFGLRHTRLLSPGGWS